MRVGIIGYGNLGRGAEAAISHTDDIELVAVFTRRNPESLKIRTAGAKVCSYDSIGDFAGDIKDNLVDQFNKIKQIELL